MVRTVPFRAAARFLKTALVAGVFLSVASCGVYEMVKGPSTPFDPKTAPPAPDYSQPRAWLAFPGHNGLERSVPAGMKAIDESHAPADVFFIHPTTYTKNDVWNAPYDASGDRAPLNLPVLLGQLSVFNGCCKLYAPQYRQDSLYALGKSEAASALAYSDVARAFKYFISHESHGRPFILASHSQGTGHLVRLLQEEVLGTPLQNRLIAVYAIGGYVPSNFGSIGLPICANAPQINCIISWNTAQTGRDTVRDLLLKKRKAWWQGAVRDHDMAPHTCVNPLTWTPSGVASANENKGSLPFPKAPFPTAPSTMPALVPNLTGAVCNDGLLEVDIPSSAPPGFHDTLSFMTGSYHLSDYGVFYSAIRQNAAVRVASWMAAQPSQR